VWSLLAALGLFVAGAVFSVTHGVQEHLRPAPATDFVVGYVVLAASFLLEGISFLRSVRQARPTAALMERDLIGVVEVDASHSVYVSQARCRRRPDQASGSGHGVGNPIPGRDRATDGPSYWRSGDGGIRVRPRIPSTTNPTSST
jgi:hypothetical protein